MKTIFWLRGHHNLRNCLKRLKTALGRLKTTALGSLPPISLDAAIPIGRSQSYLVGFTVIFWRVRLLCSFQIGTRTSFVPILVKISRWNMKILSLSFGKVMEPFLVRIVTAVEI